MRVLVTGGAGYVGAHVVWALRHAGHAVVVIDDLSTGHRRAVPDGVSLIVGDVRDERCVTRALRDVDGVVHLAAIATVAGDAEQTHEVIVGGTSTVLEATGRAGVGRLVYCSSAAVYGAPEQALVAETAQTHPISAYGAAKLDAELALAEARARWPGLTTVTLRPFNVAGCHRVADLGEAHHPETHLIPLALAAAAQRGPAVRLLGDAYPTPDGTCVRDYVHVEDVARAHVMALVAPPGGAHGPFNLGRGVGVSVRDLLASVERVTGSAVPVQRAEARPGDPPVLVGETAAARRELGWIPQVSSLDEIVRTAWAWQERHEWSPRSSLG